GTRPDDEVYRDDLRLADLAEPLGFGSIWTVEHHFTGYTMVPDPFEFLSYMAGRTTSTRLGTMVVVLPWHDPLRVAEQVSMLDALSGGRVILGIGRGVGRIEFEGFRIPMDESRDRFVEAAQLVLGSLERGYAEFDGQHFRQPRRDIRPGPTRSFKDRIYAAAVSPESMEIVARLGAAVLIIPQKPWDVVTGELEAYRGIYREVHGVGAPPTTLVAWTFCDPDPDRARELGRRYLGGYYRSVVDHYEFAGSHFAGLKGFDYYRKISEAIDQYGQDEAERFFADLQVWGTPEQCVARIAELMGMVGADTFVGVFSYAGMPFEEAERNLRLFAEQVLPAIARLEPPPPAGPAHVGPREAEFPSGLLGT